MLSLPLFPLPLRASNLKSSSLDAKHAQFTDHEFLVELPRVERLHPRDINKASDSVTNAFRDDPLFVYSSSTPDAKEPGKVGDKVTKAIWMYTIIHGLTTRGALTINHGEAIAIFTPAEGDTPKAPGRGPLLRFYDYLNKVLGKLVSRFRSPEQKRRQEEIRSKLTKLLDDFIGDRAKEMVYLDLLATSPVCQGRGYGSALVKAVTDMADARGRAAFLISSNINNTAFYNSLGFVSVAEARLGEGNPTWQHDPVVIPLMVREPKLKEDEKASLYV